MLLFFSLSDRKTPSDTLNATMVPCNLVALYDKPGVLRIDLFYPKSRRIGVRENVSIGSNDKNIVALAHQKTFTAQWSKVRSNKELLSEKFWSETKTLNQN